MSEEQVEVVAEEVVSSPVVEETVNQPEEVAVETVTEALAEEVVATEPAPVSPAVDSSAPVEIFFEGAKVVRALDVLPNGTHLCEMSDGTTKHVPAEIFN